MRFVVIYGRRHPVLAAAQVQRQLLSRKKNHHNHFKHVSASYLFKSGNSSSEMSRPKTPKTQKLKRETKSLKTSFIVDFRALAILMT